MLATVPQRVLLPHDRAARALGGCAFFGPASRVPAAVRLLPHRRPSGGSSAARASGRRPGRRADRRFRHGARRLRRKRAATSRRCPLSPDRDRVRPLRTPHRARRRGRRRRSHGDLRGRDPAGGGGFAVSEIDFAETQPTQVDEIPAELPVLPLKETVVFPDSMAPLAIGQEPSIRLVDDVVGGDRLLALVTVRDSEAEVPDWRHLYEIGTAAVIHKMIRVPDGTLRILVQGLRRIRLEEPVAGDPYLVARFSPVPDEAEETQELEALLRNAQGLFGRIIGLAPYLPEELSIAAANVADASSLCNLVASTLRIKTEEKQLVLELADTEERLREVTKILSRELEVYELGTKIQSQVQSELEKGQREFFLRQQLKAIQEELGEDDPEEADVNELRERLDARPPPCGRTPGGRRTASSRGSSGCRRRPPSTA